MDKVAIVVPIYKEKLNLFERISLEQLYGVLGDYPIYYVMPQSMVFSIKEYGDKASHILFDDRFFVDTASYSKLMLSEEFYKKFSGYKYILIHQLDALVFADRLIEFVDKGYDYIGAPLISWNWYEYHVGNGAPI